MPPEKNDLPSFSTLGERGELVRTFPVITKRMGEGGEGLKLERASWKRGKNRLGVVKIRGKPQKKTREKPGKSILRRKSKIRLKGGVNWKDQSMGFRPSEARERLPFLNGEEKGCKSENVPIEQSTTTRDIPDV